MGWIHNYQGGDPDNKTSTVIAIHIIFPTLAFLALCLRLYARRYTGRSLWVDYYAALLTVLLILVRVGIVIEQTRWGLGLSVKYFPAQNAAPFSKLQYVDGPIYMLASLGFKVAFLASYLRIGGFIKPYRSVIIVTLVAVTVNQVILTSIVIFSCIPVSKVWDPSIEGRCIAGVTFYYAIAGTSIVFDLIIIFLPFPVFWKLSLQLKQKIALTCIFAIGFFITGIQVARILTIGNLKIYVNSKITIIWSTIELCLGVITCCIPTYGPLLKAVVSAITTRGKSGRTWGSCDDSAHPSRFARDVSMYNSFNPIGISLDTGNVTVISACDRSRKSKCGDLECGRDLVPTSPWHIHATTEISVQDNAS